MMRVTMRAIDGRSQVIGEETRSRPTIHDYRRWHQSCPHNIIAMEEFPEWFQADQEFLEWFQADLHGYDVWHYGIGNELFGNGLKGKEMI